MRREQEAVEDVEALRVRVAVGPGLDVARAQQLGHPKAGDRATAVPVLEQAVAEDVLTDSPDDQAFGFRRPRQVRDLGLEDVKQRVRQRARELERPAQEAMECGNVVDAQPAGDAPREPVGARLAEARQAVDDVRPRRGREKPGFSHSREPDAHRRLAAAKAEPVGRALQIEVEAVVGRGLLQAGDRDGGQHHRPRPNVSRSHATRMLTNAGSCSLPRSWLARCPRSAMVGVPFSTSVLMRRNSASSASRRAATSVG